MWNPTPGLTLLCGLPAPSIVYLPRQTGNCLRPDLLRLLRGMPRVNLLLVGVDREMWQTLEVRLLDFREPIVTWFPGERLLSPARTQRGTLILHDADALSHDDQRQFSNGWSWQEDGCASSAPRLCLCFRGLKAARSATSSTTA